MSEPTRWITPPYREARASWYEMLDRRGISHKQADALMDWYVCESDWLCRFWRYTILRRDHTKPPSIPPPERDSR